MNCISRGRWLLGALSIFVFFSGAANGQAASKAGIFESIKGIRLGMSKSDAFAVLATYTNGASISCSSRSARAELCTSGEIPIQAKATFAGKPVYYVSISLSPQGTVESMLFHMGKDSLPLEDAAMGEIGEIISTSTKSNPEVFGASFSDVNFLWKGRESDVLLMSIRERKGIRLIVGLEYSKRTPNRPQQQGAALLDM